MTSPCGFCGFFGILPLCTRAENFDKENARVTRFMDPDAHMAELQNPAEPENPARKNTGIRRQRGRNGTGCEAI
jgi:hypothetical protein